MYDQSVVRRVMDGDLDAFSKMYNDCAPAVYRRAFSMTNDPTASREVVRNTFRDIRKYANELDQPSDFDEWVFRLVNLHVEQLDDTHNQLWDEPDLDAVWEEITDGESQDKTQADEPVIEAITEAEIAKDEEPKAKPPQNLAPSTSAALRAAASPPIVEESWEPILFPPEEGAGQGAAKEAVARHNVNYVEVDTQSSGEQQEADVIQPLHPGSASGKKGRKIRYEAAHVKPDAHFSVEHVPYDYIPYEESSQEVYDRVTIEESPRAVYEKIPYHRPGLDDLVGQDEQIRIPYSTEGMTEEEIQADADIPELQPLPMKKAVESTTLVEEVLEEDAPNKKDAPAQDEDVAALQVNLTASPNGETVQTPEALAELEDLSNQWQNIDPLRLNVDEILQQIVSEVDGIDMTPSDSVPAIPETIFADLMEFDAAKDAVQSDAKQTEDREAAIDGRANQDKAIETVPTAENVDETVSLGITVETENVSSLAVEEADGETLHIDTVGLQSKQEGSEEAKERKVSAVIVDGSVREELGEIGESNTPLPDNRSAMEPPKKKRKLLVGVGFFVGIVVVILAIIYIGHVLQLW